MIPEESLLLRPFDKSQDEAFLYATWLNNYKHSSYFAKAIRSHIFFKNHKKIIDHIIAEPRTKIVMASPKNDANTIIGYLVYSIPLKEDDRLTVHFLYVKETFRQMGVMRSLLKSQSIDLDNIFFTHWTIPVDKFINKFTGMIYDPYRL